MLLTLAEVRALFETDLADAALQSLLDAAEQEIVAHAGAHDSASDVFLREDSRSIFLKRKAQSITSVLERACETSEELELDAQDYRLLDGRELKRLPSGPNARYIWGEEVTVSYVPVSDVDTRKRVQADLVKLAAQYNAVRGESSGDLSQQFPAYQDERREILSQLSGGFALA